MGPRWQQKYIYLNIYEKREEATPSVPPPSLRPSTEMRQFIVFDAKVDGKNTRFENRCLRRYDVTRSRSNLVTLRFTLVVMAEWGDTEKRKVGGSVGEVGGVNLGNVIVERRLLIHPIHPSTFTLLFLPV